MTTYAEILNADNSVIRFLQEADDWVPPAQKYGPGFDTRFVPVIRDPPIVVDPFVFDVVEVPTVSATELHMVPTAVRKPDDLIVRLIDQAALGAIGGMGGIVFLARMANVAAPTDIQQQMIDSILSVLTAADGLKSDPASVTAVVSVLNAAVTFPLGGGGGLGPGIIGTP